MVYPILGEFLRWKQKFKSGRIFSKSGRMPENSLNPAGIPAGFEIRCTPTYHTISYQNMSYRYGVPQSYHSIPYHTIWYHAYHAFPYHNITIACNTIPYHTIPPPYHSPTLTYSSIIIMCYTKPYHTILCNTIPYHTIPYHTIPHHNHTMLYHTITMLLVKSTPYWQKSLKFYYEYTVYYSLY
jgi:hypothetical protein